MIVEDNDRNRIHHFRLEHLISITEHFPIRSRAWDIQAYYSRPTTKYLTRLVQGVIATLHRFRLAVPLRRKGYG
jgi:hypothetical protein